MIGEDRAGWARWRRWIIAAVLFVAAGGAIVFAAVVAPVWGDPAARTQAIGTAWTVTGGLAGLAATALVVVGAWYQRQSLHLQRAAHELQAQALEVQRQALELQVHKHHSELSAASSREVGEEFERAVRNLSADTVEIQVVGARALDRLGCEHPGLRESVAEVWCAFLRSSRMDPLGVHEARRLIQRLLLGHLRVPWKDGKPFVDRTNLGPDWWQLGRIDLRNAHLIDADFTECLLAGLDARSAVFTGTTVLAKTRITGPADFTGARFEGPLEAPGVFFADACTLDAARFAATADFTGSTFRGPLECPAATFANAVAFTRARFEATARFVKSVFGSTADFAATAWHFDTAFTAAAFEDYTSFRGARFVGRAVFGRAAFGGPVVFDDSEFARPANFTGITCCDSATFNEVYFSDHVAFDDAHFGGVARFRSVRFCAPMTCCSARFDALASFRAATFGDRADFSFIAAQETEASIDCADATALVGAFAPSDRIWPRGWTTIDDITVLRLVAVPDPRQATHTTWPQSQGRYLQ
ncbi:pentapeptide repeat-containing protein [Glycomyces sp. NPDC047369]